MNLSGESFPVPYHETWEVVDSTKLQTFVTCPRQYFWEYVLGWRSERPNNHLHFGKAIHLALEHIVLHGNTSDVVLDAFNLFEEEYRKEFPEDTDTLYFPKVPSVAFTMLAKYAGRFAGDRADYNVLYSETGGTVPVAPDRVMVFKMDAILEHCETGHIVGMEHKTSGGKWMWEMQWPLKIQIGTYTHAMYCMFFDRIQDVKGVIVNGLFFDKRRKNFDSAPADQLFLRSPAYKTQDQMRAWLYNVNYWYSQLEREFTELSTSSANDSVLTAFPMNTESCTKYNGCPYHDFCCAWANPLQRCQVPPLGMDYYWWDPRETAAEAKHRVKLTMGDKA